MDPCQLNAFIAALSNHFYSTLDQKQLLNLGIFLSLLSKDILSMATLEDLCHWQEHLKRQERRREEREAKEKEKESEKEKEKT